MNAKEDNHIGDVYSFAGKIVMPVALKEACIILWRLFGL